ncbi:MAG TPA: hypothetical protein VKC57_08290, partial [Ktedonobacterales bacterium]|nr:hypothetical protein [Ktedonobacterales bacterium]
MASTVAWNPDLVQLGRRGARLRGRLCTLALGGVVALALAAPLAAPLAAGHATQGGGATARSVAPALVVRRQDECGGG